MSVIRQPGVLGRTTRRRLVGVSVALAAATVETLAIGLWFVLLVGSPSTATALAGLGILFCGSLLRTAIFGFAANELNQLLRPWRLGAALALTAGWIVWLFVAEAIGGTAGLVAGTVILAGVLTGQFLLERRVFRFRSPDGLEVAPLLSATLLAAGGAALLASVWVVDLTVVSPPVAVDTTTFVIRIETIQIGALAFGLFAFVAHQRRFQRLLSS
ncbi:hypothetical protein [Natrarchaeobius chitinivorans]|uniref:Uncharacterized protein n=1 Tax=Natrarchaeobius chitinivorans TaxID=1679083 RepID=A0A3N6P4T5_NATCH|nr:hypothetical protein [Natrarchaeobius chitinivorans]RQG90455.1 hypothetical protein EA473_21150 [Natrarchaeobius chitinivorans]